MKKSSQKFVSFCYIVIDYYYYYKTKNQKKKEKGQAQHMLRPTSPILVF
jgi:hypothetical protein